jgi:hypothetical protein
MSHIAWFVRGVLASTAVNTTITIGALHHLGKKHHQTFDKLYAEHKPVPPVTPLKKRVPVPVPIPFPTMDECTLNDMDMSREDPW